MVPDGPDLPSLELLVACPGIVQVRDWLKR